MLNKGEIMKIFNVIFFIILSLGLIESCARKNPNFKPEDKAKDAGEGKNQDAGGGNTAEEFGSAEVNLKISDETASYPILYDNAGFVAEDGGNQGTVKINVSGSGIKEPISKDFTLSKENKYSIDKIPAGKGRVFGVVIVDATGKETFKGSGNSDIENGKNAKLEVAMERVKPEEPAIAKATLECSIGDTQYNVDVLYDKNSVKPAESVRFKVMSAGLDGIKVFWTKTGGEFTNAEGLENTWTAPSDAGTYKVGIKLIKGDLQSTESTIDITVSTEIK